MAPWPIPWLSNLILWRSNINAQVDETIRLLPDSTRRFVSPLRVPPDPSGRGTPLVYLLAAESLSERSAIDAAELVRAAKPGAVIAQVAPGSLPGLKSEEDNLSTGGCRESFPTNTLEVIAACFRDTTQSSSFEIRAGIEVLRTIFGTTYNGHVLSAKTAAKDVNSPFLYLETPEVKQSTVRQENVARASSGLFLSGFAQARYVAQPQILQTKDPLRVGCPAYALPFYQLLVDLQEAYSHLPGMNQALKEAHRLLYDVEQGRPVNEEQLAEVQNFRLAVEGLRIALASSANNVMDARNRRHLFSRRKVGAAPEFTELPSEEQRYVLLAQAIQDQARTHGSVVAVMDASTVAGIVRHWDTVVSPEVVEQARTCVVYSEFTDDVDFKETGMESKFAGKGGAVAVAGIASLPWWLPATPMAKVLVLKAPAFLKLGLVQAKRNASFLLTKSVAPFLTPGKTFSAVVKAATSAGKTRAAAHSVVASAERATFSAMRTAFYCLMRKKQGMSSGNRPWLVLGASVAAGGGILWFGDRLEAAIESAPVAPTVARLGRGLENLDQASKTLSRSSGRKAWEDLYRSLHK